jgi:3-hydroxyisobutyrate dehydrogenase-like beta-hydroxyacid dehydrogenase
MLPGMKNHRDTRDVVGLVGLGLLGGALAERLLAAGHAVLGFDVDPARGAALRARGGRTAKDAAGVAAACRRILLSLPDSRVARTVLHGMDGRLGAGRIVVDTTTGTPGDAARTGAWLAARGAAYLDATISGNSDQVRKREVVVLAGGPLAAFEESRDLFDAFAREAFHLGPWGRGAEMKLVTNLVLGLNRAVLAEGLAFASALGFDPARTLAILRASPAYSRSMDVKGDKMVRGDFAPVARLSQHRKDVRLILEAGRRARARLPLSRTHLKLLDQAVAAGLGGLDNSAILRVMGRRP